MLLDLKPVFYPVAFFFVVYFVIGWAKFAIYQHKLMGYLLENHTEKWKELTTVLGIGPGWGNSIKILKFMFGKDDLNDPEVFRLKRKIRSSCTAMLLGALCTPAGWIFALMLSE